MLRAAATTTTAIIAVPMRYSEFQVRTNSKPLANPKTLKALNPKALIPEPPPRHVEKENTHMSTSLPSRLGGQFQLAAAAPDLRRQPGL